MAKITPYNLKFGTIHHVQQLGLMPIRRCNMWRRLQLEFPIHLKLLAYRPASLGFLLPVKAHVMDPQECLQPQHLLVRRSADL